MRVSALVSGGKDSVYSAYLAETQGWPVAELVTLRPSEPDSMMFHTPNLDLVALQAKAWGKSHRLVDVPRSAPGAEEDALEEAVRNGGDTITAGAVASSFQWARLHRVAFRTGRRLFTPLWGKAAHRVVAEEIGAGLDIRLVHLAAEGLDPKLLGARLDASVLAQLEGLAQNRPRVHVAGEGGEYETLVVDAPFFKERIVLDEQEFAHTRDVHRLTVVRAHLEPKRRP